MKKVSNLYPGISYETTTGNFFKLKKDLSIERQVLPDYEGFIIYKCSFTSKLIKKRAYILAYEILNDKLLDKNLQIYFKDLNPNNLCANNINTVSKIEYKKIKDSLDNLNGFMKILPHKVNAFMYVLKFKINSKTRYLVCQDIVHAHKLRRLLTLKALKILSKYFINT